MILGQSSPQHMALVAKAGRATIDLGVQVTAVHVKIAASVDHDFVPARWRESRKLGMRNKCAVNFASEEPPFTCRDNDHASIGQEVERERRSGGADDDLAGSIQILAPNLARPPIREP